MEKVKRLLDWIAVRRFKIDYDSGGLMSKEQEIQFVFNHWLPPRLMYAGVRIRHQHPQSRTVGWFEYAGSTTRPFFEMLEWQLHLKRAQEDVYYFMEHFLGFTKEEVERVRNNPLMRSELDRTKEFLSRVNQSSRVRED